MKSQEEEPKKLPQIRKPKPQLTTDRHNVHRRDDLGSSGLSWWKRVRA